MSKVTVLIPFYNPGKYLKEAVESVLMQTYENWKLILIDDGSTQEYFSQIQSYVTDKRITLIRNPRNLGQSKSLNEGLKLVDTPYTVQLDSDDWFYPHTLEVLVREAEKQPADVAVVSGNINIVFEDAYGNRIANDVMKGRSFQDRYDFLLANLSLWPRFYRTSCLRHIGGWPTDDPYEGRHLEDKRVLYRLIEHFRFHWVDHMLYNCRRHNNNQTNQTAVYSEMTKWAVNDALRRWGSRYKPVFFNLRGRMDKVGSTH